MLYNKVIKTIFTTFMNIEELQTLAMKEFEATMHGAVNYTQVFKYAGMKMIEFAAKEPKLFPLLYICEHERSQSYDRLVGELGDTVEVCIDVEKISEILSVEF